MVAADGDLILAEGFDHADGSGGSTPVNWTSGGAGNCSTSATAAETGRRWLDLTSGGCVAENEIMSAPSVTQYTVCLTVDLDDQSDLAGTFALFGHAGEAGSNDWKIVFDGGNDQFEFMAISDSEEVGSMSWADGARRRMCFEITNPSGTGSDSVRLFDEDDPYTPDAEATLTTGYQNDGGLDYVSFQGLSTHDVMVDDLVVVEGPYFPRLMRTRTYTLAPNNSVDITGVDSVSANGGDCDDLSGNATMYKCVDGSESSHVEPGDGSGSGSDRSFIRANADTEEIAFDYESTTTGEIPTGATIYGVSVCGTVREGGSASQQDFGLVDTSGTWTSAFDSPGTATAPVPFWCWNRLTDSGGSDWTLSEIDTIETEIVKDNGSGDVRVETMFLTVVTAGERRVFVGN